MCLWRHRGAMQQRHLEQSSGRNRPHPQQHKVLQTGIDPIAFVKETLERVMKQDLSKVTSFCYKHGGQCPVYPVSLQSDDQDSGRAASACKEEAGCEGTSNQARSPALQLHVAGFNCYDWSSMGSRRGWFGPSRLPFVQWLSDRRDCNLKKILW